MAGFNRSTIEFAKECIPLFRASGAVWPELSSPERLVWKIERQLSKQKLDNLLDVVREVLELNLQPGFVAVAGRARWRSSKRVA